MPGMVQEAARFRLRVHLLTFKNIKMAENTIMIYKNHVRNILFINDPTMSHGEFYTSVIGSNSIFLKTGKYPEYGFGKEYCTPAKEEEIQEYKLLAKSSKHKIK
jgi:hypothetical protein